MLKKMENKVENIVSGAKGAVTGAKDAVSGAKDAVTGALDSRAHTVSVRLDAESLKSIDEMVHAEVVPDRATAVAFLVQEGIRVRADLFGQIHDGFERMQAIKRELRSLANGLSVDPAAAAPE